MFALNGIEIAYMILVVIGIGLALAALGKGADLRLGLLAILLAVVIPVFGPLFAVAYGVVSLTRRRTSRKSQAHLV